MRLVFFHNVVAPYRHSLFAELSRLVDLDVLFSTRITRDRNWNTHLPGNYRGRVLKSRLLYLGDRPFIYVDDLEKQVASIRPHAVIAVHARSNFYDAHRLRRWSRENSCRFVPFVGDVDSPSSLTSVSGLASRLIDTWRLRTLRNADGCIYYSEASRAWAEGLGVKKPFCVGTQGIDDDPIPRLDLKPLRTPVEILYVGKLEERKGFDLLVRALIDLRHRSSIHFRCTIVGQGPQGFLLDNIRLAGIPLNHIPAATRDELWPLYRDSDFVVVPSRSDPWGFVVNESMAVGTPVLASTRAGACELARFGGWICDPLESNHLAAALVRAVTDCRQVSRRTQAFEAARALRPTAVATRIHSLLASLTGQK